MLDNRFNHDLWIEISGEINKAKKKKISRIYDRSILLVFSRINMNYKRKIGLKEILRQMFLV